MSASFSVTSDGRKMFLPVCEVVFMQVQESRGDVTGHLLENQRFWGHVFCSPAALEVPFHIPLKSFKIYYNL